MKQYNLGIIDPRMFGKVSMCYFKPAGDTSKDWGLSRVKYFSYEIFILTE